MFKDFFKNSILIPFAALFAVLFVYAVFIQPPRAFPLGGTVVIPEGTSIDEAARILEEARAIRSPQLFSLIVRLTDSPGGLIANSYSLPERETVFQLAYRFAHGETGMAPIRVTIVEGLSAREIAGVLKESLHDFDENEFMLLGSFHEGYLFPDTYYFLPGTSPEVVVETMRANFNEQVRDLEIEILESGKTVHEIVTMASLLEKEARRAETKSIVAGILWKRIEIGMPLQVDAVFGYILGRSGYAPLFADLEIESPYNTYLNRGLPPGPIANPGLVSIEAALRPTETDYLYYLTGADGLMYYAKTFEQHKVNRSKLR